MRHFVLFGAVAIAVGTGIACTTSSTTDATAPEGDDGGTTTVPPGTSSSSGGPEAPAGTGGNTGLPCDVQAVLENRCITCHTGVDPGVPRLLTFSDLAAKSNVDPTKTLAQVSLERMRSATLPMPPKPAEPADLDEISVFEEWIAGGTKKGEACTEPQNLDGGTPTIDGGAGDGGCTSNTFWAQGNEGDPLMNPGQVCQGCHQVSGGPAFSAAGTVYPTLTEPNNCNGVGGQGTNLTVIITDAQNREIRIPVNAAGNFYTRTRIRAPFRARITDGVKTRTMMTAQTAGDCNRCHSSIGMNGAPGRILAP